MAAPIIVQQLKGIIRQAPEFWILWTISRTAANMSKIRIATIIPMSGPAGLYGPSSRNCTTLALEEANASGGFAGREAAAIFINGGQKANEVAATVKTLIENEVIEAVIGMHDSNIRRAVVEVTAGRVPYFYTPPYEGGETGAGVFALGETPTQQLEPAINWLSAHRGVKSWYLIGNDYIWPHKLNAFARGFITQHGGSVVAERYAPFNVEDFSEFIDDIGERRPDALLLTLIGEDAVAFNREFGAAGLGEKTIRLCPLAEENTLLAISAENTTNLMAISGYFAALPGAANRVFKKRYRDRFGVNAPAITALGQSCYEGVSTLKFLADIAGGLTIPTLVAAAEKRSYTGPRGTQTFDNRHVIKDVHLAVADGHDFRLLADFEAIKPY
jgi:urea transport system substrate-binding protein